jgi:hypothetical protein
MTLDELLKTIPAEVKAAIEEICNEAGTWDADWQVLKASGELLAASKERVSSLAQGLPLRPIIGAQTIVEQELMLTKLRAELAAARKDWCDDDEAIKQQALRVLDAAKVEGDSVYVPRMGALAEMMADEMVKARDELAAAKAASVVPVEIQSVYVNKYLGSVVVFIGDEKGAVDFDAWLCDRAKERGE